MLLAIFGSLAAAMLPITQGAVAVLVTGGLIYFLSLEMQLSVFVSNVASLLGIGVAVDYSLIILARVRQELAAGRDLATARRIALATSGTAVIFSGITVIVSLLGLWVVPNGALRSMALGAIIVVAMSVIASVTLLPALITLLGARRLTTGFITTSVSGVGGARGGNRKDADDVGALDTGGDASSRPLGCRRQHGSPSALYPGAQRSHMSTGVPPQLGTEQRRHVSASMRHRN